MNKVATKTLGGCLKVVWYFFALTGGCIAGAIANVYVYNIAYFNGYSFSDIWLVYPVVSIFFLIFSLIKPCYFNGVMVAILATFAYADPNDIEDEVTEWFMILPAILIVIALLLGGLILAKSTITHTVSGLISSGFLFLSLFIGAGIMTKMVVAEAVEEKTDS